jgi:hypothetical protein
MAVPPLDHLVEPAAVTSSIPQQSFVGAEKETSTTSVPPE